ncbi:MAG: tetratricopeptide repeat protein [Pyrinomonadaceae bacterium]|nr:tetratricopeptide repeat protein [Pyrinomonadaceae bacterium]
MKSNYSHWLTVVLLAALASPTFGERTTSILEPKHSGQQTPGGVRLAGDHSQPSSNDAATHHATGTQQYKLGRYKEALEAFKQSVRLAPNHAESYYYLGMTYSRLGRYIEAVKAFRSVINLDPKDSAAHANLGALLAYFGQYGEALEILNQAIRLQPNDADAYNNLGIAYGELGRYAQAVAAFKMAIQFEPHSSLAHNNLGLAYHRMNHNKEAIEPFRQAVRLDPNDYVIHSNLGLAYSALGQYKEAVEALRQAVRLDPSDAESYSNRRWVNIYLAGGEPAALDAQTYLRLRGWRNARSQYMVIAAYLGYRQARRNMDASRILDEAAAQCDTSVWPYPVIRHLRRDLTAQALLGLANDSNKVVEAQAYIGINLALSNRRDDALPFLRWVRQNGDQKFIEYRMAVAELQRLEAVVATPTRR